MTSLFSRLRKLNKEATPNWRLDPRCGPSSVDVGEGVLGTMTPENAALIVECRNSLPAVLNAIDLLRRLSEWDALAPPVQAPFGDGPFWKREIDAALEPFNKEQP